MEKRKRTGILRLKRTKRRKSKRTIRLPTKFNRRKEKEMNKRMEIKTTKWTDKEWGEEEKKEGEEEKKEGEEEEEEDDGYPSEYYDEEGNFIWGKEGNDWDWYYKEDKEAYERGERSLHHPNVLNPPQKPLVDDGNKS
eukprot:CAMPEP_0170556352 /NCGR_PEP_ID=MMETSP0211-20121228/16400_1 /TAXON_ID=311385 /ORGANISM="Pseudokeronopsis sp., Strain OXSARD2" /LENGTH=137 /DNA_ID=CAMNT_0010866637 /DNA_START=227 /DNA_END=642 /DNA_ORIENTATION=-